MSEPVKGVAYEIPGMSLVALDDPAKFFTLPVINVGDFKVSKDSGSFVNLTTLPTLIESGFSPIKINLSATEMDASQIIVIGRDALGVWQDMDISFDVSESSSQTVLDILEGDHVENSTLVQIFKKGTAQSVLKKNVGGSLLDSGITITTTEDP